MSKKQTQTVRAFIFPKFLFAVFLALAVLLSISVRFSHLGYWHNNETYYYEGLPVMVGMDAYYLLRLASDLVEGNYHENDELRPGTKRPDTAPLPAYLLAGLHKILGQPLETFAFYLPSLMASFMVILVGFWGYAAGGLWVGSVSALACALNPYWSYATCLGRYDTDFLNPFFLYIILFMVYRFATISESKRYIYLIFSVLLVFLFNWWWFNVSGIGFALLIGALAITILLPSPKIERVLKSVLLTAGVFIVLILLLVPQSKLPWINQKPFQEFVFYIRLLLKESPSAFPWVSSSIGELQASSFSELSMLLAGHQIPFLVSIGGLIILAFRKKEVFVCLIPALVIGLGGIVAQRLLLFLFPMCALGLGVFLGETVPRFLSKRFGD